MALTFELIGGEIAHVGAINILDVDALVQVGQQVLKSVPKKVAAALVSEGAKLGHASTDNRNRPT